MELLAIGNKCPGQTPRPASLQRNIHLTQPHLYWFGLSRGLMSWEEAASQRGLAGAWVMPPFLVCWLKPFAEKWESRIFNPSVGEWVSTLSRGKSRGGVVVQLHPPV